MTTEYRRADLVNLLSPARARNVWTEPVDWAAPRLEWEACKCGINAAMITLELAKNPNADAPALERAMRFENEYARVLIGLMDAGRRAA